VNIYELFRVDERDKGGEDIGLEEVELHFRVVLD
jgi:hypothetical protein